VRACGTLAHGFICHASTSGGEVPTSGGVQKAEGWPGAAMGPGSLRGRGKRGEGGSVELGASGGTCCGTSKRPIFPDNRVVRGGWVGNESVLHGRPRA